MADIFDPEEDDTLGQKDEEEDDVGSQQPVASPRHRLNQFEMTSPRETAAS